MIAKEKKPTVLAILGSLKTTQYVEKFLSCVDDDGSFNAKKYLESCKIVNTSYKHHKLGPDIGRVSIMAVWTCPNCEECKETCYGVKCYNYRPNVHDKDLILSYIACWYMDDFFEKLNQELANISKYNSRRRVAVTAIRIHERGDYFNQDYFKNWCKIMAAFPEFDFQSYTKVCFVLEAKRRGLTPDNFLLTDSVGPDGLPNYGDKNRVSYLKDNGYFICPNRSDRLVKCSRVAGVGCPFCFTREKDKTTTKKVGFYEH